MPHDSEKYNRGSDFYSDEAQEIMGKAPSWVIRWGITVVFIIFGLILLGCWFIKYPEIVEAPVTVTTINAPVDLITRYDGLLDTIYVANDGKVHEGGLIAVLSNPARYADVECVQKHLLQSSRIPAREAVTDGWIIGEYN